jgi:hypothetical protein
MKKYISYNQHKKRKNSIFIMEGIACFLICIYSFSPVYAIIPFVTKNVIELSPTEIDAEKTNTENTRS